MFLKTLKIKKFRSINELELQFNKGINIIIGENNAGKSSIIDALRICLSYGKQWRDIGVKNDEDFYIDATDIDKTHDPIEFDLIFEIEDDEDRHLFASMLHQDAANPNVQNIQMHFRYFIENTPTGASKMRWQSWGGSVEGQQIDANEAQLLYYTYLAPLRNAEQELKPFAKDNKISSLFRELTSYNVLSEDGSTAEKRLDQNAKDALALKLQQAIGDEDWSALIDTGASHVNEHLDKADIRRRQSRVHLRLLEYKYDNIIKGIVTRKPVYDSALLANGNEHKQRFFDVAQNGLGENNLIFASAVLGDLKNRRKEKKEHYYSLLIEEPEAHLHPQRQTTFFNYLNNLKALGLQIFITSHSPTLTAKANLDNVIVLHHQNTGGHPFTVKNSDLTSENKSHLRKFLDVTKSQLLFSSGTILVEGISEALLLQVFACIMGDEYDLDSNGIEVVNIGGVAFESFARLYNSSQSDRRLPTRCAILSDDDKGQLAPTYFISNDHNINQALAKTIFTKLKQLDIVDDSNRIIVDAGHEIELEDHRDHLPYINEVINRRRNAISIRSQNAQSLQSGNLSTFLAEYTFEYALMVASEINYRLMMAVYKKMHPRTEFIERTQPIKLRSLEFVAKLDANQDKSIFAEQLAQVLEKRLKRTAFVIPEYIRSAIQWVVPA